MTQVFFTAASAFSQLEDMSKTKPFVGRPHSIPSRYPLSWVGKVEDIGS